MKRTVRSADRINRYSGHLCIAVAAACLFALLFASSASATLEQVATFAEGTAQSASPFTGGTSGAIAVNTTGAGGVPAGTFYTVISLHPAVSRFSPRGDFRAAWGWRVSNPPDFEEHYERCGPDGEPSHPICLEPQARGNGEGIGRLHGPLGIAVDQTTGYVYVLNEVPHNAHELVQVFSADGTLVTSFGDKALSQESGSFEKEPEKAHFVSPQGIAVDQSGKVYVSDSAGAGEERLMLFMPQSASDHEHYFYAGRASDVDSKRASGHLALDASGHLYSSNSEFVKEFLPADPDNPLCEYKVNDAGLIGTTVDPASGEVFYWDEKTPKQIRRLTPCAAGEFKVEGSLTMQPSPGSSAYVSLAFNPTLQWEEQRPAGVLYAAAFSQALDGFGRGYIFAPAEVRFPSVESEFVTDVTVTSATLNAQIDPRGSDLHYAFQYLPTPAWEANPPADRFSGATEAPVGGADIDAAQEAQSAVASLFGLTPDSEYHYRVVASSRCEPDRPENLCEDIGADQTFRTYPVKAPGLADDRGWELVSPPLKNGGEAFPLEPNRGSGFRCKETIGCKPGYQDPSRSFPVVVASDGNGIVYRGQPFSPDEGGVQRNEYLSRRQADGWQTTILAPALFAGSYEDFDSVLSKGILFQGIPTLTPEAPPGFPNLYSQPTANPSALVPLLSQSAPAGRGSPIYAGASDDLTHVFFAADFPLTGQTPFAPAAEDGGPGSMNLYEWVAGQLRLVNVLPGNVATEPESSFGSVIGGHEVGETANAISADGSRVFWSGKNGQVYVRIAGQSTVAIPDSGHYLAAAANGARVLLENGHIFDLETGTVTDLTQGAGGFLGVTGTSSDLAQIYFVATSDITGDEENDQGAQAQEGKNNLYAWHQGAINYVATFSDAENSFGSERDNWLNGPFERTAQASPDGRWLAFRSAEPLTGYDNKSCLFKDVLQPDEKIQTLPCPEVFLYDSQSGALVCASCNPTGAKPLGAASLPTLSFASSRRPQPRYLTDAGRLYFDTRDSLSPSDTNRVTEAVDSAFTSFYQVGAEDVYQYEPQSVGSCRRPTGCVSLLSAGREAADSNFLAIDADGDNVFFTTRDKLVRPDRDELMDVYDARVDGGLPSEAEGDRGECQGEACQPSLVPPSDPPPGSSGYRGAGNVNEPKKNPCRHGRFKKKHKCVKKHKAKAHPNRNRRRGDQKRGAHR